jgi:hypothetical protein
MVLHNLDKETKIMTRYSVKYQTISQKTKQPTSTMGINVIASSVADAKQQFKAHHIDNMNVKYKIISVTKTP